MNEPLPTDPGDEPPDSPYEWLTAEWLPETWEHREPITPSREVDRFRRTTAGSIVAAGLLGIERVLQPRSEEDPPVVTEAPGEPPGRRFHLELDPDDPAGSVVVDRHPEG